MKKGRFINWQKTRVIESKGFHGEFSPYWTWVERHTLPNAKNDLPELQEPARANPDILAAEDDEQSTLTRDIMRQTLRDVKLSKNERLTLQAFSHLNATEESVANKLGFTRRALRIYLHRAQKKCEKLFVAKMRQSGV